jgi:hypothetical protein
MQRRLIARGRDEALAGILRAALPPGATLAWQGGGPADGDALVLVEPDAAQIRSALADGGETPVLLLRTSALPGRIDLDWLRPPAHVATRRARLTAPEVDLDAATILAEAGPLAWPQGSVTARPGEAFVVCEAVAPGAEDSALAAALGDELLAAARTAAGEQGWTLRAVTAAGLPAEAHGAPVLLPPFDPALWQALASGAEVILCGPDPQVPDTCHAAPDADALVQALRTIAWGIRRNDRDRVMAALAIESLFLALPASGPSLAAALAEELAHALRRPPRITIIVNCYNYREFVRDAVLSACTQSDPADEILVVDDGSTDGSMEALAGIEGITILRKANGGQASAFNLGVAEARGDAILFLDADDRLLPTAVETLRQAWRPGLSRMQFALETIDAQGHATGLYPDAPAMLSGDVTGRIAAWGNYPFMPTSGNLYAVEALRAVMPIPEEPWRLCADHYLAVLTPFEGEVLSIRDVLGQYRVHGRNGHFHPFGDLAFRELHHLKYRIRAWRDLMAHLAGRKTPGDELRRLQVHRRLLAAASDARTASFVRWSSEAVAALKLAAAGGSLRRAGEHVGYAMLSGLRRLWPPRDDGPVTGPVRWPWPAVGAHRSPAATCSTWPLLRHGSDIDARTPAGVASWPGWGWRSMGRGHPVEADRVSQFAFRLPWHPSHWMLRLKLARPLPQRLVVTLNGQGLLDVTAPASLVDILLPAELLQPHGGSRLCSLTLRTVGKEALRVESLQARAVPRAPGAAPLAVPGRWLRLGARTDAALALGAGWDWPERRAVTAQGQLARLQLTLPAEGRHWMVRLRCDHLGPTAPILFVDGTRCPVFVSEDGRTLTLRWQRRRPFANPVPIDIVAPRGEGLDLRLTAVRADLLDQGRPAFDEPQEDGATPAEIDAAWPAGPVPLPRRLVLTSPVAGEAARARVLLIREGDEHAPAPLLVTGPRLRVSVIPGLACELRVPLDAKGGSTVLALGPGRHGLQLKSVTYVASERRTDIPVLGTGDELAGDALAGATLDPGDWMDPVEGAIWLRATSGCLAFQIDRTSPAPRRLTVDVLTLPGDGLRISCDGSVVDVAGSGVHAVAFDLRARDGNSPTVVEICTRTMVPLPQPIPGAAMIGGAVTGVRLGQRPGQAANRTVQ